MMSKAVIRCRTMLYVVVHCRTLWYVVVHCRTLWYIVVRCRMLSYVVERCCTMAYVVVRCHPILPSFEKVPPRLLGHHHCIQFFTFSLGLSFDIIEG